MSVQAPVRRQCCYVWKEVNCYFEPKPWGSGWVGPARGVFIYVSTFIHSLLSFYIYIHLLHFSSSSLSSSYLLIIVLLAALTSPSLGCVYHSNLSAPLLMFFIPPLHHFITSALIPKPKKLYTVSIYKMTEKGKNMKRTSVIPMLMR